MNSTVRTIAKNTTLLMGTQLITWGMALILTIALPRYLGASSIGVYATANSLLAIIGIVASFGMETLMTKEVARSHDRLDQLFGTVAVLRAILYLIGFIFLAIYVQRVVYPPLTVYVIIIFCVVNMISQLSSIYQASLIGLERMEYVSLNGVATKAFATVVTLILLLLKQGVLVIATISIGTSLVGFFILSTALRRVQKVRFIFDYRRIGWILKTSFPYMMSTVFLVLYMQVDIVIMSRLVEEKVIGWYSAADSLFASMLFVSSTYMMVVFPVLARLYTSDPDKVPKMVRKSFDMLLLVGIPIGMGLIAISKPLVALLYGPDFAGSGPVLAVLGIVLILTYLNILLGQYMISIDRQVVWTVIMAILTVVTVPLDLVFVPWCQNQFGNGAIGGALSFVVTELSMVVAGIILAPRGVLGWKNAWVAARTLLAGAIMCVIVWQVRDMFLAIPVLTGVVVYGGAILLMKVVPKEDWALLKEFGQYGLAKIRRAKIGIVKAGGD